MTPVERLLIELGAWVHPRPDGCYFELEGSVGRFVTGHMVGTDGPFTVCELTLPVDTAPFRLDLRPKTDLERTAIARGEVIDVETGDAAFDVVFVVEGAPSEVTRALLGDGVRAAVLSAFPCFCVVAERRVSVRRSGTWGDARNVAVLLGAARALLAGYERVPDALERRRALTRYRGQLEPATAAVGARARREVQALGRIRRRRALLPATRRTAGLLAAVIGVLLAVRVLWSCVAR